MTCKGFITWKRYMRDLFPSTRPPFYKIYYILFRHVDWTVGHAFLCPKQKHDTRKQKIQKFRYKYALSEKYYDITNRNSFSFLIIMKNMANTSCTKRIKTLTCTQTTAERTRTIARIILSLY